ncbi:hypothetical protein KUTeg_007536 [Tegillarca granosa]|uniref:ERAP1-like C-terminal domain-containing protein n=1 Tax=Tegillarca granosa TaxID=220873 RepID=A0ABQ9FGV3_TEGGR|nr:hypothetical protein KUTeg_007536 [Tegillarca granosa]
MQQYGFYRVNYDQRNWKALIDQLNKNHSVIHMVNRAQIINDAWELVKADMLDIGTALDLLSYLIKEKDYIPWYAAVGELEYVDDMLSYTALYGQYQDYMRKSVNTTFNEIGMDIKEDDPLLTM